MLDGKLPEGRIHVWQTCGGKKTNKPNKREAAAEEEAAPEEDQTEEAAAEEEAAPDEDQTEEATAEGQTVGAITIEGDNNTIIIEGGDVNAGTDTAAPDNADAAETLDRSDEGESDVVG